MFTLDFSIIGRQGVKDPIRYLKYEGTLITNEGPSPSAVWIGIIDSLCALYEQFCKMAVIRTQIIVIGGEVFRSLHDITVAAFITCPSNARKLVSVRPLSSPLRPLVLGVHISSLGGSLVLDHRISPGCSTKLGLMTYIYGRFPLFRIGAGLMFHLRFSLFPCFIKKSCTRRIRDFFFLGGRFPTGHIWDGPCDGTRAYGAPGRL